MSHCQFSVSLSKRKITLHGAYKITGMRILPERQKETEQVATMKENEASSSFLLNTIRDGHKYMKMYLK